MTGISSGDNAVLVKLNANRLLSWMWSQYSQTLEMKCFTDTLTRSRFYETVSVEIYR
jgi:hypothetical protein